MKSQFRECTGGVETSPYTASGTDRAGPYSDTQAADQEDTHGTRDYIEHPDLHAALSHDLSGDPQLHLPKLQAPMLEEILEDQLEAP
jgi:hypothetical protein